MVGRGGSGFCAEAAPSRGSMEPRIEPTVHDLANRVRPCVVAPGHCTGRRAKAALAHRFAPGNYGPSVVGSLYALRAM